MKQSERDEIIIRLDERSHETQKDIKEIKTKLYGNGKEGVCAVLIKHDTTLKNIKTGIAIGFSILTIVCAFIAIFL